MDRFPIVLIAARALTHNTASRLRAVVASLAVLPALACQAAGQPSTAAAKGKSPQFQHEQEWLVAEVVRPLFALARFGATGTALDEAGLSVTVRQPPGGDASQPVFLVGLPDTGETRLEITGYLWSPDAYVPVARRAGAQEGGAEAGEADADGLLARLADLKVETLQAENDRLSQAMARHPRDPAIQEEAAFLQGAFALREAAGFFSDTRVALGRMTAHLAYARALRGERAHGTVGQLAEIMLLSLVKRQRDAVEKLDGFKATSKGATAWATALRIRLTWDWRLLADPARASLVERLAHFRALGLRFDTDKSGAFLDAAPAETVTDWRRLTFLEPPTVGDCGRFVPSGVDAELEEMETALAAADARALNETPAPAPVMRSGGAAQVRILDRGQWAAFSQRHLLSSLLAQDVCYRQLWSQLDSADQAAAEAVARFGELRLFPILAKRWSRERAGYVQALQGSIQLVRERPELVNAANWVCLLEKPIFAREGPPPAVPPENTWFVPAIPFGTVFDHNPRLYGPYSSRRPPPEVSQSLIALAPYEGGLRFAAVRQKYDNRPPFEAMRDAFGPLADYDVNSMYQLANAATDKPEESRRLYTRVCETYDKYCVHLARLLVSQGQDDAAAAAYRRWVAGARDRIYVSNEVEWLVNYEYDHGRKEEAFRLARMAADVYSSGGLQTLAKLLEKTGDVAGAESYFRKASERYNQPGMLLDFYRRRVEQFGESQYQPALTKLKQQVFPQGLTSAKVADFGAPPVDGVLIRTDNDALKQAGLAIGDVIVALDGYRVRDFEQYQVVRSLTDSPEMILIAWHGGRYVEIRTSQKERRFGVDMVTYPPRR